MTKPRDPRDVLWCIDERHGEPCPQPCVGCEAECRKKTRAVSYKVMRREFDEDYVPDSHLAEMVL